MPALRRIDPLPTHELAIRLFYLYDHFRREPVVDSFPDHTQVTSCDPTYLYLGAWRRGGGQEGQGWGTSDRVYLCCVFTYNSFRHGFLFTTCHLLQNAFLVGTCKVVAACILI